MFHIVEKESGVLYFKDLELHTIELKKFCSNSKEELTDIVAKVKTALDVWSAFLTRNDLLMEDNLPAELNNPDLKKAINVLNVMNFEPEERETYEGRLKWLRMEASTIKNYEQKGLEKGIKKGIKEGIKRGLEKGIEQGKQDIIIGMLKQKIDESTIKLITGFSQEDINKLKTKLKL